MKRLVPICLIVGGATLLVVGLLLPRYHNQADYDRRYMVLAGPDRAQDFRELRRESLTMSLTFQDYGLCSISWGLVLVAWIRRDRVNRFLARSRRSVALFGGVVAILTVAGQVGSLRLDLERGEFPHWADSIGIPLAGVLPILLALVAWSVVHALLFKRRRSVAYRLTLGNGNWWLAILMVVSGSILLYSSLVGDFWLIIPAAGWIAFYGIIWVSRPKTTPGIHPLG